MAELVWETLSISITLLFGINVGLAMGLIETYKKEALIISIFYGLVLMILSMAANLSNKLLYGFIDSYISLILGIVGAITLLGGIYTVDKWRKTKSEYYPFSSVAMVSSSICCFVGFVSVAVLLSKEIKISFLEFSALMAITMVVMVMFFYLFSKILRNAENPYPVLLGNFMILNGFCFLISAAFVPNIKKLASVQTTPVSINSSVSSLIFMAMAAMGVFLIGVYLKEEGITSLGDIHKRIHLLKSNKTKKT
jgi:predicted transporter